MPLPKSRQRRDRPVEFVFRVEVVRRRPKDRRQAAGFRIEPRARRVGRADADPLLPQRRHGRPRL